jgi:Ca2+-binding RTX toxin-like protein
MVKGNAGNDMVYGGNHIDKVFGGEGKDTLKGTPTTTLFWEAWAMI